MDRVDKIIQGAADLHIHSGPCLIEREVSHVDVCLDAMKAEMKAVVLKDHHCMTANIVPFLEENITKDNPLKVFGSIVLNNSMGGVNPKTVECAINYGAKIVWFPTLSAKHHKEQHGKMSAIAQSTMPKNKHKLAYDEPITILGNNGRLVPEIRDICQMIAGADIVLGTGHLSRKETDLLIEEAQNCGVNRIILDHPEHLLGVSFSDMKNYADAGVYVEHVITLVYSNKTTHEYLYEMLQATGLKNVLMVSDLGQKGRPRPIEGMRKFIAAMLDLGMCEGDICEIICNNPCKLLGI